MISITFNEAVKARLMENLQAEDEDSRIRIREYTTGTPCCRKTTLGFTIDEQEDDDIFAEIEGLPIIINEDLLKKWGDQNYMADMDEHNNPRIVPLS